MDKENNNRLRSRDMGFSLELFFQELNAILQKNQKPARSLAELRLAIFEAEKYARECGQID